ncbi:MAG: energy-coupling factor transporter ATPase [Thermoplasmata archaeon]
MDEPVVELRNIKWHYPNFGGMKSNFSMENFNLTVYRNEFLGITGATGSGKSTLCQLIAGLIPHQIKLPFGKANEYFDGEVIVLGNVVSKLEKKGNEYIISGKGAMAPEVGLVMQDPESQFLTMSALNELSLGLQIMGLPRDEIVKRIKEALEMVGLEDLYPLIDRLHPSELSGGQKQRLVIASFLAMRPKVLILDEPTSDLDSAGKIEVIEAISRLREKGDITVILVEHDPEILKKFVDRLVVLHEGKILAIDKPENIFSDPGLSKYIEVSEIETIFKNDEDLVKQIDLEAARVYRPNRRLEKSGGPALEVKDLKYEYPDGSRALNGVNLTVNKGEFIALIGQNGSGKSTFSKIISGYLTKWEGEVKIFGKDISEKKVRVSIPETVGYVFQNPDHQIFNRRVDEEIAYGLKNIGMKEEEIKESVDETLKRVGLSNKKQEDPLFLSRGEKRRLALASVIAMKPEILIVDEPTTGQDYRMSREIMEILLELNREGSTIIVITHDMRLVAEYCRRIVVMKRGRLIFDGTPEKLFENEELLKESSLLPPKAVQISKKLKESGIMQDLLLSAKEWLDFLKFENEKKRYVLLSFDSMKFYAKKLSEEIIKKYGKPDIIIYIERGGMVIARLISDYLGVKDMLSIRASYYTDEGVPSTHVTLGSFDYNLDDVRNYILLVDDIADTGKTLQAVLDKIKKLTTKPVYVCTVAFKPHSEIKPDIFAYTVDNDTWVVFEYEEQETKRAFQKRNNEIGLKFMEEAFGKQGNKYK